MQNRKREDFEKNEAESSSSAKPVEHPYTSSPSSEDCNYKSELTRDSESKAQRLDATEELSYQSLEEKDSNYFQVNPLNELSEEAQKVFCELLNGSQTIDKLFEKLGIELSLLNAVITDLEMEGLIQEQSGGRFRVIPDVERLQRNSEISNGSYWHLSGNGCAGADCAVCNDQGADEIGIQIADFCRFIGEVYQGFSRRFSGLYLVLQKFRIDWNDKSERIDLFHRCLQMGRSGTLADCTNGYVTPLLTPFYLR
ncbi:MAG: hypothetical protein K2Y32_23820 [Candidatus Obscuribacterales bacterium]|nr:hypothetical protein [Candidatus Obscuribacterales bacterium]